MDKKDKMDKMDKIDKMDEESCPNDGTKMHNANFTKNDVRKVRNVRILKIITILSANFYNKRQNRKRRFFICSLLPSGFVLSKVKHIVLHV